MGVFSRRRPEAGRRPADLPSAREARAETVTHFREFVRTRVGVEAYVEPPTAHDPFTIVLVARTGEWTRRRVPDEKAARALARELAIPVYDVHLTGYPASMRQWSSANRGPR
ncbi:oxidoreductase [Georgenia sp. SYP-B2076]|uniref:oxidoreductase n=1 Tax=Georgenia sp. SYP-B2076 TaxID=2495881 RepID=UPI000F8F1DDA|nr:oxidoreductase [Georgenia sp. SYP-B2076]